MALKAQAAALKETAAKAATKKVADKSALVESAIKEIEVLTLKAEVAALAAKNAEEEAPASSCCGCLCLNSTAKLMRKAKDAQRKVDKAAIAAGRMRFSEVRPALFSH